MEDRLKEKLAQITPKQMTPAQYESFMTRDYNILTSYLIEHTFFNGRSMKEDLENVKAHIAWLEQQNAEPQAEKHIKAILQLHHYDVVDEDEALDMILMACEQAGYRDERTEKTLEICGYLLLLKTTAGGNVEPEDALQYIDHLIYGRDDEIPPPPGVQWSNANGQPMDLDHEGGEGA